MRVVGHAEREQRPVGGDRLGRRPTSVRVWWPTASITRSNASAGQRRGVVPQHLAQPERVGDARRSTRSTPVTCAPAGREHVREQQPDRAEPDHRRAPAAHVAEPVERVEHGGQRLDDRRLDVAQVRVDGDHAGRRRRAKYSASPRCPLAQPTTPRAVLGVPDDLVQREPGLTGVVDEVLAAAAAERTAGPSRRSRPPAAARAAARRRGTGSRRLDALEPARRGDRVRPHPWAGDYGATSACTAVAPMTARRGLAGMFDGALGVRRGDGHQHEHAADAELDRRVRRRGGEPLAEAVEPRLRRRVAFERELLDDAIVHGVQGGDCGRRRPGLHWPDGQKVTGGVRAPCRRRAAGSRTDRPRAAARAPVVERRGPCPGSSSLCTRSA